MQYYENLAEMYTGDDVSPDFYGWVFPKCDHVAVGTGTIGHKPDIKKFQDATRHRARDKILGGKIIRVEACYNNSEVYFSFSLIARLF